MTSATPTIDPGLDRLVQLMLRIARLKKVPLDKVLRNASRDFVKAAYFGTPTAKTSRTRFLLVPGRAKRTINTQNGPAHWVLKKKSRQGSRWDPPFPVRKGYAKATWIGAMRALGMVTGNPGQHSSAPGFSRVNFTGSGVTDLAAEITNSISYISRLDRRADFTSRGIAAATAKIEGELARMAAKLSGAT